jgi:hypothetical protein
MVYFYVYYADPGNDAKGYGFMGINGTRYVAQRHSFTAPGRAIVTAHHVAYPLDLECGTAKQHKAFVEAWVYDTAGTRSQPVFIRLACAA